jgi:hypothetical protein
MEIRAVTLIHWQLEEAGKDFESKNRLRLNAQQRNVENDSLSEIRTTSPLAQK